MVISHRHKFIFVKTAKTAGTSIEVFLFSVRGEADVFTPFAFPEDGHTPCNWEGLFNPLPEWLTLGRAGPAWWSEGRSPLLDLRHRRKYKMHLPAWQIQRRIRPEVWRGYFKFCVERNPYEKVLSGWHYYRWKNASTMSLDEYLESCARRIESHRPGVGICPYNYGNYTDPLTGATIVDRILRFEQLEEELHEVFAQLGIAYRPPLPTRAKGDIRKDRRPWNEILTDRQVEEVANLFHKEFALHAYGS